ncbi:MAG: hypothetical protein DMG49_27715 [Acidobacteria bacterium]|nr:MAG: hypothetical protein DMG49_27715 [Acidobacteriota bacterium]
MRHAKETGCRRRCYRKRGLILGPLANFVNLFNPQSIILGGAVPQVTKTFFLKSLSQALRYRAFHRSVSNLKLLVSHRVGQPGAVGVALVVAEQLSRQFCTSNYSD